MLDMRPATMADADMLFAWANDPGTRAYAKSHAAIPREDHDRWMQFNVLQGYPKHIVMIADSEYGSVGVVRFDTVGGDVMTYRVSITISPQFRGRKLAHGVLAEACRLMSESTLLAEIRPDNAASKTIFERCGFTRVKMGNSYDHYRREPQL